MSRVKNEPLPLKRCLICGNLFQPNTETQKYCSRSCAGKANKMAKRPREELKTVKCVVCGKEFQAYRTDAKYCGKKCEYAAAKERYRKPKPQVTKNCIVCGREFVQKNKNHICCGEECSREHLKARAVEKRREDKEKYTGGVAEMKTRPITPTTRMLMYQFAAEDGYAAEQIAKELNRDIDEVQRIYDEMGLEAVRGARRKNRLQNA